MIILEQSCVVNAVATSKTVQVKNNTVEWLDGEIANKIHLCDKLHKKIKLTKLHFDEKLSKEAQNTV